MTMTIESVTPTTKTRRQQTRNGPSFIQFPVLLTLLMVLVIDPMTATAVTAATTTGPVGGEPDDAIDCPSCHLHHDHEQNQHHHHHHGRRQVWAWAGAD